MSSITLEPNSVQSNNNESTNNQVNQTKEAENLHIANDTTNENVSENQAKSINKYIYPEFEGPAGYDYLLSIAQHVLPYAYWRTWQAADSYQAPGQLCYVSVEKLSKIVGPQERKLYLDLQGMQRRELAELRRIRMQFLNQEGKLVTRPVTVKDFSGFYHVAHDYHLWRTSNEYLAPDRENLPLIYEDEALVKRLIRFENYRRLLVCAKPGKKSQQEGDYYEEQVEKAAQMRTSVQELNQDLNTQINTLTLNPLESILEKEPLSMVPNPSTAEREKTVEPKTIRNISLEEKKQRKEQEEILEQKETFSKSKTPPTPERKGAAAAKQEIRANGYTEEELKQDLGKRGAAAAGIPAEHHRKLAGGKDETEEQEQRQRASQGEPVQSTKREIPAQLIQEITQFAKQYDSAHLIKSDVTRAAKIYFTAAQTREFFHEKLFWAFYDEAMEAAKQLRGCGHTNAKGRVNRVPYFFSCLENAFEFSLEELVFLRSDYPLFTEIEVWDMIDHLRETYEQQRQGGQTHLDYRSWLSQILDQQEHRKKPKKHTNVTAKEY
jgi:hypothetical protein